jgi:quinol monooxygenase YgiN
MAIKAIVELKAKPGQRAELRNLIERMVVQHRPNMRGFLGSTLYDALDDPDLLVEIADWESAEARMALMQDTAAMAAFAPVFELLAAPFRATVVGIRI